MSSTTKWAKRYAELGYGVFPCEAGGKRPATGHGFKDATTDPAQIADWWPDGSTLNVGLSLPVRVVVVDVDTQEAMAALQALDLELPATATQRTPRGGWHFLYLVPDGVTVRQTAGEITPGVDTRVGGLGYICAEPSRVNGSRYHWDVPPTKDNIAPAPAWLLEKLAERPRPVLVPDRNGDETIPEGRRNAALASLAGTMRRRGLAAPEIEAALAEVNKRRCMPPLSEREVGEIARSVERYAPAEAPSDAVAKELSRLRVQREARRLLDAEGRPPIPAVLNLAERLAATRPPREYRVGSLQPAGCRALLAAQYKAGKTTLRDNLVRCLVDGTDFLGTYTTRPCRVALFDTEMNEERIEDWLRAQNIRNADAVLPIPLRGHLGAFDLLDDARRAEWAAILRDHGTEYLMLDCLRPLLDALGLDENHETGRLLVAFDALLAEAGVPDALLIHHMGHIEERSRGDSRLRDWPDVEWRLVRESNDPASPRFLSAYGRDVEVAEQRLDFDASTRHLTAAGGSRADAKLQGAMLDVLELLDGAAEGLSIRQVEQGLEWRPRAEVRSALKLGVRQEKIGVKEGARKAQIHYLKDECAGVRRECAGEVVSECASDYRERRTHGEVEEVDGAANSNGALESRKCPECESLASKGIDSKCSKHFV